jgi:hypothetical protein
MPLPQNVSRKYDYLIADIDQGRLKLPRFQRDFVWNKEQTAKLIDSIIKQFPLGTFIIWKTREELPSLRNIGNIELPELPAGDSVQYILDGQQRITSLYAVRHGLRITRDGKVIDYKDICVDIDAETDADEESVFADPPEHAGTTLSVHDLLTKDITDFDGYTREQRKRIQTYRERLTGYDFSVIEIPDHSIDVACEIFTRINTGGKALSIFEIIVAKTYDPESGFDLEEKYKELIKGDEESCLEDAGFETIPPMTILQCLSAHLMGGITHKDLVGLDRGAVADAWPHVRETIFAAVDYLQSHLGVAVSRLLPYPVLLVPFSRFFDKNDLKHATPEQGEWLRDYFFRASLGNRFTSGVATRMAGDLPKMAQIAKGQRPTYSEDFRVSPELIATRPFAINDSFSKAVICLLASQGPKNLNNNGLTKVNNSWLRKASSKNLHHIFPKAYVKKAKQPGWDANLVANIMIAEEYLNQRVIRAKSPKDYMTVFEEGNPGFRESLMTHLIDEECLKALLANDYDSFINHRAKLITEKIK